MQNIERVRDFPAAMPEPSYFEKRSAEGWRLLAVEWERGAAPAGTEAGEEVPFGLRVARDCRHLEPDPDEIEVLMLMKEVILQDGPLSRAAQLINERGFRTRAGRKWTAVALFEILPRLIDMGPKLNKSSDWVERRRRLSKVG